MKVRLSKKKKVIFNAILISLIPTILSYLGKSKNILDILKNKNYIGTEVDINSFKEICTYLNIFVTFIIVTINGIVHNMRESDLEDQRDNLIKQCKEILVDALSKELGIEHLELNFRIFVQKKLTLADRIKKFLGKDYAIEFIIKNINGLADKDITNELKFEVYPKAEGLVGKTFNDKCIYYDCNLENTNKVKYELNHSQINKTNELKFSLTCPIFKNEGDEIIAILAIDSKQKIDIKGKNKELITNSITNFSTQLYEYVPSLFKKI